MTNMNPTTSLDRDRLSVLSGALLLALALGRFLEVPVRPLRTTFLGSPLGLDLSATTVMLLIIVGMSITAAETLVRSHPLARQGQLRRSVMFWIVPGLLGLALAAWLGRLESLRAWAAGLLACALLIPLALAAEYTAVDPDRRGSPLIQWSQMALIHLTAAILFTLIYDLRARSLLSASAMLVVTTLLAARLLWPHVGHATTALLYGAAAGLLLAQVTWAINYWPLSGLQGGLLLLLLFYVAVGLVQQTVTGRFGRRVVLEYAGIGLLGVLVVFLAV